MKMTKLRLVGATNVDLPIIGADASGPFVFKGADGLGPPDIVVNIGTTTQEGGIYQNRKAQNRQVIIRVGLQPEFDTGQTSEELRTTLYGLLTPRFGQLIRMEVWDDNAGVLIAQTEGHFSKFEPAIFAKETEVQLTLDTTSPYLNSPSLLFQIPAEGVTGAKTWFDVENIGSAPSGFMMAINLTSTFTGPITINDNGGPTGQLISVSRAWTAGDQFILDTRPGQRGVWRKPSGSGAVVSVLNDMDSLNSEWLQLYSGTNRLWINNINFDWVAPGFGHTPAYWGV